MSDDGIGVLVVVVGDVFSFSCSLRGSSVTDVVAIASSGSSSVKNNEELKPSSAAN